MPLALTTEYNSSNSGGAGVSRATGGNTILVEQKSFQGEEWSENLKECSKYHSLTLVDYFMIVLNNSALLIVSKLLVPRSPKIFPKY